MEVVSDPDLPLSIESTPTPAVRRRKRQSLVWEHFTIETVSSGCRRACCKRCKQTFVYSTGSKVAGTSHLKRHIALGSCPQIKNQEQRQLALTPGSDNGDPTTPDHNPKRRYRTSSVPFFDQDRCCENLAKMIVLHEYQFNVVDNPAFLSFVHSLQPRFESVSSDVIEQEVLTIYHKEKQNLMQAFKGIPGRISLTIGLWTTSQSLGYVCLTGQFIDATWKLHRRMLNFMMVNSPHSENALSEAIGISLSDWDMKDKLFTITLDSNCSSHDIYSANLRDHLSNKNTLVLRGQLFVVRCYVHILNSIAQDVLASIHGIIYNIRESIKYVKASPAREVKFSEIVLQVEIPATKTLSLDIFTQWDTTYLMLASALEFKPAFVYLESCDDGYNEAPSSDDWRKIEVVHTHLKLLYESVNSVGSAAEPTANIFFHEAWKVQLELTRASTSEDVIVSSVAKEMHEKFDKYWKDCSLILSIAVVMDPRFKMKLIEFSFTKIYGDNAAMHIKVVNDAIHELYLECLSQPQTPLCIGDKGTNGVTVAHDGLTDFDKFLSERATNDQTKSELDQYLEESLVPRVPEFDILNWWKLNELKYLTLSKMARDVLSIPMSMVGPGSVFGTGSGSRVLDEYRSSLRPETVEALFCLRDWLQYAPTTAMEDIPSNALVKMEQG